MKYDLNALDAALSARIQKKKLPVLRSCQLAIQHPQHCDHSFYLRCQLFAGHCNTGFCGILCDLNFNLQLSPSLSKD